MIYQEQHIRHKEEQLQLIDYTGWLNGIYIINAIQTALDPKKAKYYNQPMFEKKEEKSLSQEEKFLLWIDDFNRRFEE